MRPSPKQIAYWYKKLKQSGFKDIEDSKEDLIVHHSFDFMSHDPLRFDSNRRYYELAGQLLNEHPFQDAVQKSIWRLHSEGNQNRAIAKKLKVTEWRVFTTIRDLSTLIKVQ